ncbi:MAG: ABC transporter ATP-binding protein [Deltaproteobacteria bacterium]|nr:ABC transporter ATP-binding protein [Deltaproteobacteria bacterium]
MDYAVEVKNLHKTFSSGLFRKRRKSALKGVDLMVPKGTIWGLLGPNGAGKTTLLSILSNLLTPEKGDVRVLGMDIRTHAKDICGRINLSSGHANFLWSMTVRENLEYYAMLYGLSGEKKRRKIENLLDLFRLQDFAKVRFEELSTGTKQKLSLSKALLNDPDLLFLDEPTVGLDPDVAHRIRDMIQHLHDDQGTTILITTHNMKEAEILCEKVTFIMDGRIRAKGTPRDLKKELHLGDTIHLAFQGALPIATLQNMEGIDHIEMKDSSCRIRVDNHRERLPQILDFFTAQRIIIHNINIQESDLEDVFITFTK